MATTNKIAVSGGLAILVGGIILSFYTAMSVPALKSANAKIIAKYAKMVDENLAKGDKKAALKAAKEALKVDPTNKDALDAYKKVILADAPKASTVPATKPQPAKSAAPAQEDDEDMGCI